MEEEKTTPPQPNITFVEELNKEDKKPKIQITPEETKEEPPKPIVPPIDAAQKKPLKGKMKLKHTVKKVIDTQNFAKSYQFNRQKKALEASFTIISASIPRYLYRLIKKTNSSIKPGSRSFYSIVGYLKFAGYSQLSEVLTKRRQTAGEVSDLNVALEELIKYLNLYYADIVKIVYEYGGDIIRYTDKGFIVFWPVETEENLLKWGEKDSAPSTSDINKALIEENVEKALKCMLHINKVVDTLNYTNFLELQVHLGLACGYTKFFVINSNNLDHYDQFITGDPLIQAFEMSQMSMNNGVTVTKEIYDFIKLKDLCGQLVSLDGGIYIDSRYQKFPLTNFTKSNTNSSTDQLVRTPVFELQQFLILYITSNIREGICCGPSASVKKTFNPTQIDSYTGWLAEIRRVTVCNILFPDLKGNEDFSDYQTLYNMVLDIIKPRNGTVKHISLTSEGIHMEIVFGLTSPVGYVSHAVKGGMELSEAFEGKNINSIIGISTGFVYCCVVGSPIRCDYTLSGDCIDTAKKLISNGLFLIDTQNRTNVILCDGITREESKHLIYFEFISKIKLKGKIEEVLVYEPFEQTFLDPNEEKKLEEGGVNGGSTSPTSEKPSLRLDYENYESDVSESHGSMTGGSSSTLLVDPDTKKKPAAFSPGTFQKKPLKFQRRDSGRVAATPVGGVGTRGSSYKRNSRRESGQTANSRHASFSRAISLRAVQQQQQQLDKKDGKREKMTAYAAGFGNDNHRFGVHMSNTTSLSKYFDKFTPQQQMILKICAVIGYYQNRIYYELLYEILPVQSFKTNLRESLSELVKIGILKEITPIKLDKVNADLSNVKFDKLGGDQPVYSFKRDHAINVLYEQLLLSQRQDLHYEICQYYEKLIGDSIPSMKHTTLCMIAHHWNMIADERLAKTKTINYLHSAAMNAFNDNKYLSAIEYYEIIIDMFEMYNKVGGGAVPLNCCPGLIYLRLGQVNIRINQKNDAIIYLEKAFESFKAPKPTTRFTIVVDTGKEQISYNLKKGFSCFKKRIQYVIPENVVKNDVVDLYGCYCSVFN